MHLIRSLAADLVDTYKEKQKYKLQHTFVKASIDAEAKAEGIISICNKIKYNISILLKVTIKNN